jgi:predicted transcriptional regulator
MKMNQKMEKKLTEAKMQLRKNETGSALILLDQALELCLRDECVKHGATTETKIGQKQFSYWGIPDYLKFLDSKSLLTRKQKSFFFKVHDWRNKVQHSGLEPKREQIEEALRRLEPFIKCGLICAGTIMNVPVVGVDLDDHVSKAATLMKDHDYSQLPIFDDHKSVGSISEKTLLNFFEKYGKPPSPNLPVREIMDRPFPFVDEETPLTEILKHLRSNHGVLVTKQDHVVGIITKADLLKLI